MTDQQIIDWYEDSENSTSGICKPHPIHGIYKEAYKRINGSYPE